jgi:hypothetical protein
MSLGERPWSALANYATHSDAPRAIEARVLKRPSDSLVFQYVLHADMAGVRVPKTQTPGRADGLWKHTCFEAFVSAAGIAGYYELNFSPSRQWALYSFDGYRKGMSPVEVTSPPRIASNARDDRLELEAEVSLLDLGLARRRFGLKLALTAVVEDGSGTLSYWALKHAPGKPDFHRPEGFVLELTL